MLSSKYGGKIMSSLRNVGARAVAIYITSAVAACSTSYVAPQKVLITASEPMQCQSLGEVRGLSGFGKSWSRENALHKAVAIGANTVFYPEEQPRNIDLSPGIPE